MTLDVLRCSTLYTFKYKGIFTSFFICYLPFLILIKRFVHRRCRFVFPDVLSYAGFPLRPRQNFGATVLDKYGFTDNTHFITARPNDPIPLPRDFRSCIPETAKHLDLFRTRNKQPKKTQYY